MKQPNKAFLLLVIALSSLIGCGNEAVKIDPHFIGIWNGSDATYTYHLSIDNHSNGYWEQDKGGKYHYAQGVARIRHNELYIGLRGFQIEEYPTQDSVGTWSMNLSGIVYTKQ